MNKRFYLFMLCALLGSCANYKTEQHGIINAQENEIFSNAKSHMRVMAHSQENIVFKHLRLTENHVVCGEIGIPANKNNQVKYYPFYYQQKNTKVFARIKPKKGLELSLFNSLYNAHCQ